MSTEEKLEKKIVLKKDNRIEVEGGEIDESSVDVNKGFNRDDFRKLLDSSDDKHFVFFYGSPAAGKTAVLGSMLYAMQQPGARGKLFVHGAGDNFFSKGLILWKGILTAFQNERFPIRSSTGSTIQLLVKYKPDERLNHDDTDEGIDIVFLEMSGEDLTQGMKLDKGDRSLPSHIDIFLQIPKVKLVFIVTAAWDEARESDAEVNEFITFLNEKYGNLIESRFLLLITKWDTKKKKKDENILSFVQREMPSTFTKLKNSRNVIQKFSVGNVIILSPDGKPSDDDIIRPFDIATGQRLFDRIYETFTGISHTEPPSGIVAKICNFIKG